MKEVYLIDCAALSVAGMITGVNGSDPARLPGAAVPPQKIAINPAEYVKFPELKYLSRFAQLLLVPMAFFQKRGTLSVFAPERVAVVTGSVTGNRGSLLAFRQQMEKYGGKYIDPLLFPNIVDNTPGGQVATYAKITGPNVALAGALSGFRAVEGACDLLNLGAVDAAVVLAAEAEPDSTNGQKPVYEGCAALVLSRTPVTIPGALEPVPLRCGEFSLGSGTQFPEWERIVDVLFGGTVKDFEVVLPGALDSGELSGSISPGRLAQPKFHRLPDYLDQTLAASELFLIIWSLLNAQRERQALEHLGLVCLDSHHVICIFAGGIGLLTDAYPR